MAKTAPTRMCAACRAARAKNELVRVVRTPTGDIVIDRTGKTAGRGAYLCASADCVKKAKKSRALERALGAAPQQVYADLEAMLDG